jgi:spermidine/putrescine transport system substrate-binding protein
MPAPVSADHHRDLVLLNWAEYIDPELVEEFEARHGVDVREVYFESDDIRDEMLARTDGRGYDLAIVNGVNLATYRRRGWIQPVDPAAVPNLRHIDPRWAEAFEAAPGYAVPYFWGTLGIGYRTDKVAGPVDSWMQIFEPAPEQRGRIIMNLQTRDLVGMALRALGYSVNSTDPEALAKAEALLMAQKPYVKDYGYVSLTEESSMVKGEVDMAMLYSGDALMLREVDERIEYVVPKEGCNLWVDYLVIMRDAPNKALALKFIDFLNEPENAARLAEFVWYASPNLGAEPLLDEEFKADPVVYPNADVIARCEFYESLPPRVARSYNAIFSRVTN